MLLQGRQICPKWFASPLHKLGSTLKGSKFFSFREDSLDKCFGVQEDIQNCDPHKPAAKIIQVYSFTIKYASFYMVNILKIFHETRRVVQNCPS